MHFCFVARHLKKNYIYLNLYRNGNSQHTFTGILLARLLTADDILVMRVDVEGDGGIGNLALFAGGDALLGGS